MPRTGRPRVLDETKQREICALVSAGCGVREAARYVGCSRSTIHREAQRNPAFRERLDRAAVYAELSPLRAMQQAVNTHWRAAAWMLERTRPERFARRDPRALRPQQARALVADLVDIVNNEIIDPNRRDRIAKRVAAAMQFAMQDVRAVRRTGRSLRRAMKFFDEKSRRHDPFEQLGFAPPDFDEVADSLESRAKSDHDHQSTKNAMTLRDLTTALAERIHDAEPKARSFSSSPPPADQIIPQTNVRESQKE